MFIRRVFIVSSYVGDDRKDVGIDVDVDVGWGRR